MEFRICHLWLDALNHNGSQGNVLCLRRRMEWRSFDVSVTEIPVGSAVDAEDFDLIYLGAGHTMDNRALWQAVEAAAVPLQNYAAAGGALLAVGEGYELLCESISFADGPEYRGLSLLPADTVYGEKRLTGNLLFSWENEQVAAFENHAGCVLLKAGSAALGKLLSGHGNNDLDDTVGARQGNVFGCHAYGPLLPKNPALADAILSAALERRHGACTLAPLDDTLELDALRVMTQRLSS